jgi:superfamily II DNA/RNA helicase
MRAAHERSWLRRLRVLVDHAQRVESKVAHLARLLQRSRETIVIFTEFRHSLEVLERRLSAVRPLAILHGGQTDHVRRQQLDRFLGVGPLAATSPVGA